MIDIIADKGGKVFTADGKAGFIKRVSQDPFEIVVEIERKETIIINEADRAEDFKKYYLIGKTLLGNKIDEAILLEQIEAERAILEKHSQILDAYRKQVWTLRERMVPDWRERKDASRKAKEEAGAQAPASEGTD